MEEIVLNIDRICLDQIAESGQQFTWQKIHDNTYTVIDGKAYAQITRLAAAGSRQTLFIESNQNKEYWERYFDIGMQYTEVWHTIMNGNHRHLRECYKDSWGIRILRQDLWQTICGFIISQNNNIPRIRKSMKAMCDYAGDQNWIDGTELHTFPDPQTVADMNETRLKSFGLGYRSEYIHDAAAYVVEGGLDLRRLTICGYDKAKERLQIVKGIGEKVADCICLYGLGYHEAFPKDVWIKRIMTTHYPYGMKMKDFEGSEGIIQQILFEGERKATK